jgi:uncharacterized protein (TIGR03435 family)
MLGGFRLFRVVGGPDWMRTDRYEIGAKADRLFEVADRQEAVMGLLAERFQLESHREAGSAWMVLRAGYLGTK